VAKDGLNSIKSLVQMGQIGRVARGDKNPLSCKEEMRSLAEPDVLVLHSPTFTILNEVQLTAWFFYITSH